MKRITLIILSFIVSCLAPTNLYAVPQAQTSHKDVYYMLDSKNGFKLTGSSLEIQGVDHVEAITNRPYHQSRKISIEDFTHKWNSGFYSYREILPTASLEFESKDGAFHSYFLTLSDPSYDSTTKSLRFSVKEGSEIGQGSSEKNKDLKSSISYVGEVNLTINENKGKSEFSED